MSRKMGFSIFAAVFSICLIVPVAGTAQQTASYATWEREQITKAMTDEGVPDAMAQNGNGISNQVESPSIDQASTSLVDTSSASDFVSMALSLSGITAQSEDNSTPMSGSVTATLYSLIEAARGVSITDPYFYKKDANWRRIAFTIGTEESKPDEDFTDKPSTNVGFKYLIINDRDIYSRAAQARIDAVVTGVGEFQSAQAKDTEEIQCLIFKATVDDSGECVNGNPKFVNFFAMGVVPEGWPETLRKLESNKNKASMQKVQEVIKRIATNHQRTSEAIAAKVEEIKQARQFSVAAYTKQRDGQGTDSYRAELIYDHGMSPRLNWTVNAGFDYLDRKTSEDSRDARIATELQAKLGNPGGGIWKARPVTLSASGEAMRGTESTWLVQAQVKLLVPITTGVDLPIAYTYANRNANGISAGSRLKISLAVDPVRFREWLTSPAGQRGGNQ